MSKILIVYGSSTGNTENIARLITRGLSDAGHDVTLENAANVKAAGLAKDYDAVLMGASVWGDTEIELQDDFDTFFEGVGEMGLENCRLAAFASGERGYEHFCGAVDVIENRGRECGAILMTEGLRLEGDGSDSREEVAAFVEAVLQKL